METRHIPPLGQSLIGAQHTPSKECSCKPKVRTVFKQQTSGRGGSHQGRKIVRYDVVHQAI